MSYQEKLKIVSEKLALDDSNLEQLADFLLQGEKLTVDDVEYKIYTDKTLFNKALKDNNNPNVLIFYKETKNYKKEKKQHILPEDLNNSVLLDYQKLLNEFRKMKKGHICGRLKTDQILAKDDLNRTIYFKSPMQDSTKPDYTLFNFEDVEHIICLMKFSKRKLRDSEVINLSEIIYDMESLLNKCILTENERTILYLWRDEDATYESIGNDIGITKEAVCQLLKSIAIKIKKQYLTNKEDWLYLNYKRGSYKRCSKCGEVKLISKFNKQSTGKNGVRSYCKKCS